MLVRALLAALLVLLVCAPVAAAQTANANPVLAGEWPDPTVVNTDHGYFGSATSGNWAPIFRILWSGDLRTWKVKGHVFTKRPRWASHDFWAPEFVQHGGRWLVFYNARRKGPPVEDADEPPQCIGVATAAKITGPYRDSGAPVMPCGSIGAIDPFAIRDENGRLTLIWKEDGNTVGLPARIFGQPLSDDGTRLVGAPSQLLANDPASWEGSVIEAPTIVRRNGFFYLLYAGNLCCGPPCTYAEGVARSRRLLGPWRRLPGDSRILRSNSSLICPGHGSIVFDVKTRRDSFIYHAYRNGPHFLVGRQLIRDDVGWRADGFPTLGSGSPSFTEPPPTALSFFDPFRGRRLKPDWEWRAVAAKPRIAVRRGRLALRGVRTRRKDLASTVLTRRPTSGIYTATTKIRRSKLRRRVYAGLAAFRSRTHSLLVAISRDRAVLVHRDPEDGQRRLAKVRLRPSRLGFVRIRARGDRFAFYVSRDGRRWRRLDGNRTGQFEGSVRIALTAGGGSRPRAEFESFRFKARR